MTRTGAICVLLGLASCASSPSPTSNPAAPEPQPIEVTPTVATPPLADPRTRLEAVEGGLLGTPTRMRFEVRSSGAFASSFVGTLQMEGKRVELRASGVFGETPVELSLIADGERMVGKGGARDFDLPQAEHLREALAVSIVRMGILHTLARLVGGVPPDRADGGVREWLALEVAEGEPTVAVMDPKHAQLPSDPITFRTRVDGRDSLTATLWIDDELLVERQQTTVFGNGEMKVLESFDPL